MKKKSICIIVVLIAAMMITVASAKESTGIDSLSIGGNTSGEHDQNVNITLNATNISGVGDLEIEILYNSSVLSVNDVTNGTLDTGTIESSSDDVNKSIKIGAVGINGSGIVATMNFTVVGNVPGHTNISILLKELVNNTSQQVDRQPVITNGTFTVTEGTTCESGVKDCIAPITSISGVIEGTTYDDNVTVKLNATDDESGVNETFYMVNGGTTKTYSAPFVVDIVGDDNVTYWSTDNAGNVEPQNIINFIISEITSSPGNGKVKGKVFRDSNHNGILDADEHGMKGVRVSIKGLDETNKDVSLKVRSTTKGYEFSNLPDGKYSVHVSHRHRFTHTSDTTVETTIVNGNTVTVDFGKRRSH